MPTKRKIKIELNKKEEAIVYHPLFQFIQAEESKQ